MSGSEPYAEALLSHVRMEHILAVVGLAWPFALTLSAVLLRWKELRSRVGLLVSGVLGCRAARLFGGAGFPAAFAPLPVLDILCAARAALLDGPSYRRPDRHHRG